MESNRLRQEALHILDEITENVVRWQSLNDGGWSIEPPRPSYQTRSDVWTTGEVVQWLLQVNPVKYQQAIDRGLKFLINTQHLDDDDETDIDEQGASNRDGGWGSYREHASDTTGTSMALLALVKYAQTHKRSEYAPYLNNMKVGRDWLINHVHTDGGYKLLPQQVHSLAFGTCWCSIAVRECSVLPGLEDPRVSAGILPGAVTLIESSRVAGGWGSTISQRPDAIGTAYCTYFLLYTQRAVAAGRGLNWLRNNQSDDGSWDPGPNPSPIEATAWALIALLDGGDNPKAPRIEGAVRFLEDHYISHSGWPIRRGESVQLWTTYYACLALEKYCSGLRSLEPSPNHAGIPKLGKTVFIVHGHDDDLRQMAKDFVVSCGLAPMVLEEQPNLGMTLSDKFKHYASQDDIVYALVLCTPDDIIASENTRVPRQNVVFELAWFSLKLGAEHVCVVADGDVTLPSDVQGIAFVDRQKDDWRERVKRELVAVGLA